ncbi:permease [Chloroflexota bacterium]
MKRSGVIKIVMLSGYVLFLVGSLILGFEPGEEIGLNFASFSVAMLKILPGAFILIGLFEVWVKRKTVERHLGKESGGRGYLWGILLASTTVGGLYVAFPVAYSLYSKGARLSVIFTYVGAAAICRIPMSIFEASFLGIEFTVIRLVVSIPLVILTAMLLGNYLEKRNYRISGAGES